MGRTLVQGPGCVQRRLVDRGGLGGAYEQPANNVIYSLFNDTMLKGVCSVYLNEKDNIS